jgi:hypothetical protein
VRQRLERDLLQPLPIPFSGTGRSENYLRELALEQGRDRHAHDEQLIPDGVVSRRHGLQVVWPEKSVELLERHRFLLPDAL